MMNDQEMQFADPEWRPRQGQNGSYAEAEPYHPRPINDDRPQPELPPWEEMPERVYKAQELPPYQPPPYQVPPVMSSPYQYSHGQVRPRRRRSPWLWLIAVLIVLSMLGSAMGRFGGVSSSGAGFWHKGFPVPQHAQFEKAQSFNVGLQPTIIINDTGGGGDITVQGTEESNQVVVQADGQNPAVSHSSDEVQVNMNDSDVTVTVPNNVNLTIIGGDGDVTVDNVNGPMRLSSGDGDITMQDDTLTGNSTIQSSDGDITFQGQLETSGSYQFISSSGSVNLTLPSSSSFSLNATASNGSIDAPGFPLQVQTVGDGATAHGDVGNAPPATLTVTSDSGDITLSAQ